ncbi:hypothetical protein RvY_04630 [Ramazzottius varieornatus]|uniref:Cysteine dioxygenase n=1 Tax=Ramazzottius varieornatus TaxID=947166 RepID=A0A1D1US95_RAMVA|nr:hypothetical protein RvY_04630 [Ramazzottius varieornatus]
MTLEDVAWKAYELFSAPSSFQRLENPVFSDKLRDLRNMFHRVQLSDLKYDEAKLNRLKKKSDMIWYMSIVDHEEDEMLQGDQEDNHTPAAVMTIAAFLLKPGARLPIHNHPKMYGIMKVLHGQLKLQSYSSVKCLDSTSKGRMPQLLVRKSDAQSVTPDIYPLLIHRNNGDVHEVCNETDEMAVFIDILAPPYDFRIPNGAEQTHAHRYVSYYRELGPASPDVLKAATLENVPRTSKSDHGRIKETENYYVLEEIKCPDWYETEHLEYEGPSLNRR